MDCGLQVRGTSQAEHWRGLLVPSPGDLPKPGTEPASPAWQAGSLLQSHQGSLSSPLADSEFQQGGPEALGWRPAGGGEAT